MSTSIHSAARQTLDSSASASDEQQQSTLGKALMGRLAIVPVFILATLILASLANAIQPVTESRVSATNPVLLLKLSVAGMAWVIGAWGVLCNANVRSVFRTLPGAALLALAIVFLVTSLFASPESALISRAAALILTGYLLCIATAVATVGVRRIVIGFLFGSSIYLVIAWLAYLLFPSFGQFYEYTDATTTVSRMGGLAHPNSIAREAAIALIICLAVLRNRSSLVPSVSMAHVGLVLLIGLAVVTMYATLSRTSVLAATAAVGMLMFDKLYSRRGVLLALGGLSLALVGFLFTSLASTDPIGESATAVVTKSGDIEELTSLTGRTTIWAEALGLIAERPLTGYGLDSAASVMSKESVGTHSLMLHILFSGGVFAGLLMLLLLAFTLYCALASRQPLFRGLATYVLVSGLVEDALFPAFPGQMTLLWIAMVLSLSIPESTRLAQPSR